MLAARRCGGRPLPDPVPKAFAVALEETDSFPAGEIHVLAFALAQDDTNPEAFTDTETRTNAQAFANTNPVSKTVVDPKTFPDTQTFTVDEAGR